VIHIPNTNQITKAYVVGWHSTTLHSSQPIRVPRTARIPKDLFILFDVFQPVEDSCLMGVREVGSIQEELLLGQGRAKGQGRGNYIY
jgi:hypothetical protein